MSNPMSIKLMIENPTPGLFAALAGLIDEVGMRADAESCAMAKDEIEKLYDAGLGPGQTVETIPESDLKSSPEPEKPKRTRRTKAESAQVAAAEAEPQKPAETEAPGEAQAEAPPEFPAEAPAITREMLNTACCELAKRAKAAGAADPRAEVLNAWRKVVPSVTEKTLLRDIDEQFYPALYKEVTDAAA